MQYTKTFRTSELVGARQQSAQLSSHPAPHAAQPQPGTRRKSQHRRTSARPSQASAIQTHASLAWRFARSGRQRRFKARLALLPEASADGAAGAFCMHRCCRRRRAHLVPTQSLQRVSVRLAAAHPAPHHVPIHLRSGSLLTGPKKVSTTEDMFAPRGSSPASGLPDPIHGLQHESIHLRRRKPARRVSSASERGACWTSFRRGRYGRAGAHLRVGGGALQRSFNRGPAEK